jgi:Ca-activated chloride channel family protein
MATHPACINAGADAETIEAAELFRRYLLGEEAQQLAIANGLRPVSADVPADAPLVGHPGVDLEEPQLVFQPASVGTVYAVQELWQEARKDVNLVMAIDVSGSMRGEKMENVRRAARQFVEQMGEDDYLSIVAFSTEPAVLVQHERVGDSRQAILRVIDGLSAGGDTALYDAIGDSAGLISETTSPENSNAMVVLSDGQDTFSQRYLFDQSLIDLAAGNGTTVFTIAYGTDANESLLETLALQANGNYFLGDEANIGAIYEEMSAAFGGSAGVGR